MHWPVSSGQSCPYRDLYPAQWLDACTALQELYCEARDLAYHCHIPIVSTVGMVWVHFGTAALVEKEQQPYKLQPATRLAECSLQGCCSFSMSAAVPHWKHARQLIILVMLFVAACQTEELYSVSKATSHAVVLCCGCWVLLALVLCLSQV